MYVCMFVCMYVCMYICMYVQGVPHHIRPFIALNCDFRDKTKNLKRMNHFKDCIRLL